MSGARHGASLDADYFTKLYDANPDPWDFATSDYERAKYRTTIAALDGKSYQKGFEVGCSIGVLTLQLAGLVRDLLAVDLSETALRLAEERCRELTNVRLRKMQIPEEWPRDRFDLIVLSEVIYYLAPSDVDRLAERAETSLLPGGDVLLVHWTGGTDYPLSGDEAAEQFIAATAGFTLVQRQARTAAYRLDLLRRTA